MRFHRKPTVRRLHKITKADPLNLPRKPPLTGKITQMFNHRITKDHFERAVMEWHGSAVGNDPTGGPFRFEGKVEVENREMRTYRHQGPIKNETTHIQNLGFRCDPETLLESLHPMPAKITKEWTIGVVNGHLVLATRAWCRATEGTRAAK